MVSFKSLLASVTVALTAVAATPAPGAANGELTERRYTPAQETIFQDLVNLDTAVLNLTKCVTKYEGGIIQASPVLLGITAVHLANRKCYLDSLLLTQQSEADSLTILNYVASSLARDVPAACSTLAAKKSLFVKSGLQTSIVASLDLLKYDHESFSKTLASKTSQDAATQAKVTIVVKTINDAIVGAMEAFTTW